MYQRTGSKISGSCHNDWRQCITVCSRKWQVMHSLYLEMDEESIKDLL